MVRNSDLLLVVGERMGDTTTSGYELVEFPRPKQKFIHVHPSPDELGILYHGDLLINATMRDFAAALDRLQPAGKRDRGAWIEEGRRNFEKASTPRANNLAISVGDIVKHLSDTLPPNAVISNGAGTYTGFVHKFYRFRGYGSQLAPTSGAMGYGFPAAIAAKVVDRDRPAVCFAGDGCFLMASQELATAVMHDLPVVVVLVDNGSYGSIRGHQERRYPGRVYATNLVNPDFVALAKSYGAHAERVVATADFPAAFERAVQSGKPALLHLKLDIEDMLRSNPRNNTA
jgi:acetolactate synthase I/II/III large subunit